MLFVICKYIVSESVRIVHNQPRPLPPPKRKDLNTCLVKDSAPPLASRCRLTGRFPSDWDLVIQVGEEAVGERGKAAAAAPISPGWGKGEGAGNADCCCCRPPLEMSLRINYHCTDCTYIESRLSAERGGANSEALRDGKDRDTRISLAEVR
jgi:hypothetical protein